MSIAVPAVVDRYLQAAAVDDIDALAACFAEDAVVVDDGRTYHGRAEIRTWREDLSGSFEYTVEVLRAENGGDGRYLVVSKVEGNFPGSPVELTYAFTVHNDLVSELVIAP